jgi:hypothetical protein
VKASRKARACLDQHQAIPKKAGKLTLFSVLLRTGAKYSWQLTPEIFPADLRTVKFLLDLRSSTAQASVTFKSTLY